MSTAARTLFDVYNDLDEADKIHFWELAFSLKPTNATRLQELAWSVSDSFLGDLRRLREKHTAMKAKCADLKTRISGLRRQLRELRMNGNRRGSYKARQTNRIIKLVDEYGAACWESFVKVGKLIRLNPATVKSRYYRHKSK
jgi:hypothetical protein